MAGDVAARLSGLSYTFRRLRDPCRALRVPLERIMGIEPTFAAWEAAVLPMNYIRVAALPEFQRGTAPRTASVYLRATLGR